MSMRERVEAAMRSNKLNDEERLVLQALLVKGYGRNGEPLGRSGVLSSDELARLIYPRRHNPTDNESILRQRIEGCKRVVREIINALVIRFNIPICCPAGRGGGYHLPQNGEEVEANHRAFRRRALTGLTKAARARRSAYAEMVVQLTIDFEEEAKKLRGGLEIDAEEDAPPAWVGVVTKLLDRIQGDPEQYADELRAIQKKYGDIFVPRQKVEEIRTLSGQLQRALEDLEQRAV